MIVLPMAVAASARAQDGERSVQEGGDAVGVRCHSPGAQGAPRIDDKAAWAKHTIQGQTGLTTHALDRICRMPPHSGKWASTNLEIKPHPAARRAAIIAAAWAIAVALPCASAQTGGAAKGAGADLRATRATPADIADGKRVAEMTCARCHGVNGVSQTAGAPHLAAQRAAYLYSQLQAYRDSARTQAPMYGNVRFLSDDAIVKVAAYYASLDPPRATAPAAAKTALARTDPMQAGKRAAAACAGCHGETGVSQVPGTPSLIGFDPQYFAAALNAYKSGQRKHELMQSIAAAVSDADLDRLGLYYALQKPVRAQTPAPGNREAGKKAAAACFPCHGDQGVSGSAQTPSLAGQDAQYQAAALRAYKDGSRQHEAMSGLAAQLDAAAGADISAYFAQLPPRAPNVHRPLSVAEWAERCDRCHGVNGNSTDPRIPALAAQRQDWLETALGYYRSGARRNTSMAAMAAALGEADAQALAAHYAQQTARAVAYVPVGSGN